jgi:hypothetical protein
MSSLQKMCSIFISTVEPRRVKDDKIEAPDQVRYAFDVVANRRAALTASESTVIRGWIFIDKAVVKKISVRALNGQFLGSTEQFAPRPDLVKGSKAEGIHNIPENTGFTLVVTGNVKQLSDSSFVVESSKDVKYVYPYKSIAIGRPIAIVNADVREKVTFALDKVSTPRLTGAIQESVQSMIGVVYGKLLTYLGYIGLVALLIILIFQRTAVVPSGIYIILLLLFCTIVTRVFLFALIDVSSWPGNQVRYLFPAMQLYGCFLTVLIYQAIRILRRILLASFDKRLYHEGLSR